MAETVKKVVQDPAPKEIKGLYNKIAHIQWMAITLEKTNVNKQYAGNGKTGAYKNTTDIKRAIMGEMRRLNLSLLPIGKKENLIRTSTGVEWTQMMVITDGDTDKQHEFEAIFSGKDTENSKADGKAVTYGLKYALNIAFIVPDDSLDPDTEENTNKVKNMKHEQVEKTKVETVYNETPTPTPTTIPKRESIIKTFNKNIVTNSNFAKYVTVVGIKETADFEKYTDIELLNILKEFK